MTKTKQPTNNAAQAFYDWNYDINESAKRRAKIAWWFASASFLVALVSVLAVSALTPLKTIEPVFVRVDASTGVIDVLHKLDEVEIDREEAIDKYFLAKYVRSREGYLAATFERDSAVVLTMSDGHARSDYLARTAEDNPDSPFATFGRKGRMLIDILSISLLENGAGSVRFVATSTRGSVVDKRHYIATLVYTYVKDAEIEFTALLDDPLGFVVTAYRVDAEVLR